MTRNKRRNLVESPPKKNWMRYRYFRTKTKTVPGRGSETDCKVLIGSFFGIRMSLSMKENMSICVRSRSERILQPRPGCAGRGRGSQPAGYEMRILGLTTSYKIDSSKPYCIIDTHIQLWRYSPPFPHNRSRRAARSPSHSFSRLRADHIRFQYVPLSRTPASRSLRQWRRRSYRNT